MIDIDLKPSPRKLRQFGLASLVGFPLIGLLLTKLLPASALPDNFMAIAAAVGAAVCLLGLALPRSITPVYLLLVVLAFPIGLALSFILIPLIYYGVFTPIGLGLRALGKDPMERQLGQDSYWIDRKPSPSAAHYYKQY